MPQLSGHLETCVVGGEAVKAFVPNALSEFQLDLTGLQPLIEKAATRLGRLDSFTEIVPDPERFLRAFVRKEAVLSSQIEGTQSSLSDLLAYEASETDNPGDDLIETSNYVRAANLGIRLVKNDLPISTRLFCRLHKILLSSGRGQNKSPGDFRTTQNWIGGSRPGNAIFVPPPPQHVSRLMGDLENFVHAQDDGIPDIVRAGIAHAQFETIHPFLDGNGRLGRLLISLMLSDRQILEKPLLYLSLYLKENRDEYYRLLQAVRFENAWKAWLRFYLEGVAATAERAALTARAVMEIFRVDAARIESLGRPGLTAAKVHEALQMAPIATIASLVKRTNLAVPTVIRAIKNLENLGVVEEATGRRRDRIYVYRRYTQRLNED